MRPDVRKSSTPLLCLVLLGVLSGCAILDVSLLILSSIPSLPNAGGAAAPQQIEISGYTLGPISSDEFPALLHKAIPASEGEVRFSGKVQWLGLQNGERYYATVVAAITDTDILLLMWHEPENQYTIVTRLPFSEILSISARTYGSRTVYLYFDDKEVSLGDQSYKVEGKTTFDFIKPSGSRTIREKNEAVFLFLQDKIKLHESPPLTPDDSFDDDY